MAFQYCQPASASASTSQDGEADICLLFSARHFTSAKCQNAVSRASRLLPRPQRSFESTASPRLYAAARRLRPGRVFIDAVCCSLASHVASAAHGHEPYGKRPIVEHATGAARRRGFICFVPAGSSSSQSRPACRRNAIGRAAAAMPCRHNASKMMADIVLMRAAAAHIINRATVRQVRHARPC